MTEAVKKEEDDLSFDDGGLVALVAIVILVICTSFWFMLIFCICRICSEKKADARK